MLLLLLLSLLKYNSVSWKENQSKPGWWVKRQEEISNEKMHRLFFMGQIFPSSLTSAETAMGWAPISLCSTAVVGLKALLSAPLPVTGTEVLWKSLGSLAWPMMSFFFFCTNRSQKQEQRIENARSVSTTNNEDSCVFFLVVADWIFYSRCL